MGNEIEINFLEIRNHHEFQVSKPVISIAWLRSGICGPGASTLRGCCLVPHAPQPASLISQGAGLCYAPPRAFTVSANPPATFQSRPTPATFKSRPTPVTIQSRPTPEPLFSPCQPQPLFRPSLAQPLFISGLTQPTFQFRPTPATLQSLPTPATFQSRPTSTTFQSWPTPATFQFLPTPATFQSLPTSATFQCKQHLQSSASLLGAGLTNQCLSLGFQTWHMKPPTESYSVLQTEE